MVKILDCPGVIFDEGADIRLRNILKIEEIDDPIAVMDEIL